MAAEAAHARRQSGSFAKAEDKRQDATRRTTQYPARTSSITNHSAARHMSSAAFQPPPSPLAHPKKLSGLNLN
jgi:hypothetical protein